MSYFLLIYDRAAGELRELREFPDEQRETALAARFARERLEQGRPNIEVMLLGAASEEALRKTHSRYFRTARQLLSPQG
jgi:hypothetical protein